MSSEKFQNTDVENDVRDQADWSGESREQWVSRAIAAATASLRASAPPAQPPKFNFDAN